MAPETLRHRLTKLFLRWFLEVIRSVLGDYATTALPTILRKGNRGGSTLSDDVDDLRGFRLVTTTETSGAEEMDEPRVKRLSGGDQVRARGLYKSSVAWNPFFVLWLATNEIPRISGADAALWSRLRPIRFPFTFTATGRTPDGEECKVADPALKSRLMAEAPGILAWIIRHLDLLYKEGLAEPETVGQERNKLQSQQDTVGMFLAEVEADSGTADDLAPEIAAGANLKIRFTAFHKHYDAWANSKRITPVGKDGSRQALQNRKVKITFPGNVETVHGFGHKPGAFACLVCREPLPPQPRKANLGR
jgi:phage/plasmid-associated DNA primase